MHPKPATDVQLIAFYLPQFHPIPENDLWWGKGFTEWTNVAKAKPMFQGHYQPHLPADLGFYDLRLREVIREQVRLAKSNGIGGFCYHYYWFSGKRLLERPLDDMLDDPMSDMPFCLCWANENWTRRWDGADHEILVAQRYLPEDDLAFIRDLERYLRDPRYIRIDDALLLIVYHPPHLPDATRATQTWREHCRSVGIGELHLCAALAHGSTAKPEGFDSVVDFPPHNASPHAPVRNDRLHLAAGYTGSVHDYTDIARYFLERPCASEVHFRTVFPSWDNTARRGLKAIVVANSSPENYEFWLSESIKKATDELPESKRLMFINAWNEWAEGCHLEPDRRHGHAFLEATLRAKEGRSETTGFVDSGCYSLNPDNRKLAPEIWALLRYHGRVALRRAGTQLKRYPRIRRLVRRLTGKEK